ncbi:NupC/NupG family nucleoside CNT transporter [bacterium]|nr:NupC/NupG family nucleoside CNT transporter [bacterium]
MEKWISALGLVCFVLLAWLISYDRKKVDLKLVLSGVALQIIFGMLALWTDVGQWFFATARDFVSNIISFSDTGAEFIFGSDFRDHFFAFSVLPTIIFVSSIMSCLFYLGLIQKVVSAMAWVMIRFMKVSGAEALAASANVFVGQTEAPLVVKPYIETMSRSELMAMMTGGMATVAGGVMAAYASFGADPGHLLAASIMSAPASLVLAKIILPETTEPVTRGKVKINLEIQDENILDAACRGATEGLKLALNVAAMLIAFIALAALVNYFFAFLPQVSGQKLSMERVLGWVFSPMAWLMGVPSQDVQSIGALLGKKTVLNEFVAFVDLTAIKDSLSPRAFTIATYALCGFANFSSIAIQIGGIGSLVPKRRKDLAQLSFKAMIAGTLAAFMTACIAGMLLD